MNLLNIDAMNRLIKHINNGILLLMLNLFLFSGTAIAQDTIVKFDKLIANGKFIGLNDKDGFIPNSTIIITNSDGTKHFADGRPYQEITRTWVQYQKMKFYTRDQFSSNGYIFRD